MPAERLESWKEIAAYLRRGVRTVRRWEKEEGLPVHRHLHKKLGTVYAYKPEIDVWWSTRRGQDTRTAGHSPGEPDPTRVMMAVLPFENLSDASEDYFADGLTEEMISQLGRFNPDTLGVIARTSVMQFKRTHRTVRQIADELKVEYVVEGSVRREADRVRVTTHLIRVRDQTHVWAGSYDQPLRSILTLQSELAADIGREIRLKLAPHQAGVRGARPVNPDAYQAHLKGRHVLNAFTPESVRRSVTYFQRAIDADPTYAPSYASLAEAYERLPMWVDAPPGHTLGPALIAAERALQLDPTLPEAHASLAAIHASHLWDWSKAEWHFRQALSLDPGCSPARQWYAEFLAEMGRTDEALATIDRALISDPLSRVIQSTRAFVLWLGRRFDEAIAQAHEALEIDPTYPMALIRLGVACESKGLYDEAVEAFRAAGRAAPDLLDCLSLEGHAHARAGNTQMALEHLNTLRRLATERYVPAFLFANVYLGLGDLDSALQFMEKEYDARGWYLLLIKRASPYDALRAEPGFQALLGRMKFPD